jgi:sec-independent protein translocase protein TatA
MPNLRGTEWLIIILLVVLLFGAKRLPDAARSVGRSLRIFKAETKGLVEGETEPADQASSTAGSGTRTAQDQPSPSTPAELPSAPAAASQAPTAESAAPAAQPEAQPQEQAQPPHQS